MDYQRIQMQANKLASELSQALTARDAHERQAKSLAAAQGLSTAELESLRTQTSDLSRQVQALTRELAIRDDPSLANVPLEVEAKENEGSVDAVITQKLVAFRSIPQLQEQNQQLLKVTRELASRLEKKEAARDAARANGEEETDEALEEAHDLILRLRDELHDAQTKMNTYLQERDMFSRMLASGSKLSASTLNGANGSNGDGEESQMLSVLQANYDAYKMEMAADIKKAKDEVAAKDREIGVVQVSLAKANAKVEYLTG
jgi:nucleoprotein TPR